MAMSWIDMPNEMGPSMYTEKEPLSQTGCDLKRSSIETAYGLQDLDLLRTLAQSRQGLVSDELRRKVWPALLGIRLDDKEYAKEADKENDEHDKENDKENDESVDSDTCKDYDQVQLDVERAFVFYPKPTPAHLYKDLSHTICSVLARNPDLAYYQGYHDIAQVVLLIFGRDDAPRILELLSRRFLRDFMMPNLMPSLAHLDFIPAVLTLEDPTVGELVRDIKPFYGLSPVLTLFAHHIRAYEDICIVFDYIIATGSLALPIYMYVAMIKHHRAELKEAEGCDDILHSLLSNMADSFEGDLFEDVMRPAIAMSQKYPLEALPTPWAAISPYSVLKTGTASVTSSIIAAQVAESSEQAEKKEVERRKQRDEKAATKKLVHRNKNQELSRQSAAYAWMRLGSNRTLFSSSSLVGASLCVGVLGIIASTYRADLQLVWYRVVGHVGW